MYGEEYGGKYTALGNSWSIPVVAYLLDAPSLVKRLTPGHEHHLSSLLLRPPLRQTTKAGAEQVGLVSRLLGQVSVKGEDILLQLGSDLPARYHRLRASIPSRFCGVGKMWQVGGGPVTPSASMHSS